MLNVPNEILRQMFETYTVLDNNQQSLTMASNISADNANRLYQAVRTYKPRVVLEVGLAYGISALAIMTALQELGAGGKLISIDPFQSANWKDIGLLNIQRSGFDHMHEFIGELDYFALPRLLAEQRQFPFAYIDGWHMFDYVMLDFFYVDKMLLPNGVVGFNDTPQVGVKNTIRFLQDYRHYDEVKISMPQPVQVSSQLNDFQRRFARIARSGDYRKLLKSARYRLGSSLADRYFQKRDNWEPTETDYYSIRNTKLG